MLSTFLACVVRFSCKDNSLVLRCVGSLPLEFTLNNTRLPITDGYATSPD